MQRPFFSRTFGRLEKGSLRGSIFSLCACAIGSGVLSLPYVLALNGYVIGLLFIFIGAISACWSLDMIAQSTCLFYDTNNLSKLALKAGGNVLSRILQGMILIYMFGSCISYQIIITQLIQFIVNELTNGDHYDFIYDMEFRAIVGAPVAIFILLPLSLIRDMSGFRYVSFASIIALFYTGIVLIAELPEYIHQM